jgi:hypothetical protein
VRFSGAGVRVRPENRAGGSPACHDGSNVLAIAAALTPALLPARIGGEGCSVAGGVIFVGSYLALAIGRIPGLSIDRAGIALVGS